MHRGCREWGGACVWIGLTLGAQAFEVLPEIAGSTDWWPWLFIGLGPWSLVLNLIRVTTDAPDPSTSDWVWTVLFIAAAVGALVDATTTAVGAAALIGIGLVVLYRALTSPR